MKIETISVNDLHPAEYNPREISEKEFSHLKESIQKFGFVEPIVVNSAPSRKNVVIGGHMRLNAAKVLGHETVPVFYVNIPEIEREKELNLRLNKNSGHWDWEKLSNEFDVPFLYEVGFNDFDLGMTKSIDEDFDPEKEWEGMPSYKNKDEKAYRSLIIHFLNQHEVDKFIALIGQKITEKTKYIWLPEMKREDLESKRY